MGAKGIWNLNLREKMKTFQHFIQEEKEDLNKVVSSLDKLAKKMKQRRNDDGFNLLSSNMSSKMIKSLNLGSVPLFVSFLKHPKMGDVIFIQGTLEDGDESFSDNDDLFNIKYILKNKKYEIEVIRSDEKKDKVKKKKFNELLDFISIRKEINKLTRMFD